MTKYKYNVIEETSWQKFEEMLNEFGEDELVATHIGTHADGTGIALTTYVAIFRQLAPAP